MLANADCRVPASLSWKMPQSVETVVVLVSDDGLLAGLAVGHRHRIRDLVRREGHRSDQRQQLGLGDQRSC